MTPGRVARAWMPFALLTLTVLVWGMPAVKPLGTPAVKAWMDAHTSWKLKIARLHEKIAKGEAVTGHATPDPKKDLEKAEVDIVPVSSTGTAVFLAARPQRPPARGQPADDGARLLGTDGRAG